MQRFINLGIIGEGSYGTVFKCRHKSTGQLVAVKKFIDVNCDRLAKKIAVREIKMLQELRHENLISLLEIFLEKRELYIVLELMDQTLLEIMDKCTDGLAEDSCKIYLWQMLKGAQFIHLHNVIHRDLKPENILVSKSGIVKICDFGFARSLSKPEEIYTDYVATRWYRAPELLVGDTKYGRAVDIWAVGCVVAEMLTGQPLFPGDSDLDQLCLIMESVGSLTQRHKEVFQRSPFFIGMKLPEVHQNVTFEDMFSDFSLSEESISFIKQCLQIDSDKRATCTELLKHNLFMKDNFENDFYVTDKKLKYKTSLVQEIQVTENNSNECSSQSTPERRGILRKNKELERKSYIHQYRSFRNESRRKIVKFRSINLNENYQFKPARTTSDYNSNNQTIEVDNDYNSSKSVSRNNTSHSTSLKLQTLTDDDCHNHDKCVVRHCANSSKCPVISRTTSLQVRSSNKTVGKTCKLSKSTVCYNNVPNLQSSLKQEPLEKCLLCSQLKRKTHKDDIAGLNNLDEERIIVHFPEVNKKKIL